MGPILAEVTQLNIIQVTELLNNDGLLTFIDEKVQMSDFFNKNEIIFIKILTI